MRDHANAPIVGINWGSTNFRAFLIDADGQVLDKVEQPRGIAGLDRAQMQLMVEELASRWPQAGQVYACGMVGSNIGWSDAGYLECPATPAGLARQLHHVQIGSVAVAIVPGLACRRAADGAPDIMRGEETELLGLMATGSVPADGLVVLPGTHSKWVRLQEGAVLEFLTAMSGEIFDRLTAAGLLASVVDGPAVQGEVFDGGVRAGHAGMGLGSQLFGARARVIRGNLPRSDGASWLRGLLIGAELADAQALWPQVVGEPLTVVGAAPVCELYARALSVLGGQGKPSPSQGAVVRGFLALHQAAVLP
ncbi:2-dehydro-3-deoxygalactonokinase [Pseudoxanthomonas sp. GM95]|uniref:2-dehydro-3-deoxygalactonokinase n=1 Tax=Pseudoxanthomonas sp. GM95 TaxID=1881043 RepID=UPI0008BFE485|nr:2-dehydro-3-deoxygalactonokinase [Pseudoxanthomonas sp. GM95]SEL14299.1 2-dehydro-3-deoxygalactonokinase [Pseudoxanthomonas sp. GM95]